MQNKSAFLDLMDVEQDELRRKCIVLLGRSGCGKSTFYHSNFDHTKHTLIIDGDNPIILGTLKLVKSNIVLHSFKTLAQFENEMGDLFPYISGIYLFRGSNDDDIIPTYCTKNFVTGENVYCSVWE
jgi:hypothetical protein